MNFKEINIGKMVAAIVVENKMESSRICNYFKCSQSEIAAMYEMKSLDTEQLLKWSKLLKYDFFRIYTQHLILYSPPLTNEISHKNLDLPQFRKNIYTKEIIEFILEQIDTGEKTKDQIIKEYRIPKTTLYKWISKYKI